MPDLISFRLDQGIHLLETKSMFDHHKISLIGPMVTSKSFEGRNFFIGANYYYVLGIIGLVSHWNPLFITAIFIILEFVFYLFFIFQIRKKFNPVLALLVFLFLALSPYLVIHSHFFWNPHLLIPISVLTLYFLDKFIVQKQLKYLFISAFLWGFAFACHYTATFWGLAIIYVLIKSQQFKNIKSYLLIILGFLLGDLPFFIFELRHGFYNLKTMIYVFTHSVSGSDLVSSHYFVFPLLIFGIYLLIALLFKLKNIKISYLSLIIVFATITIIQFKNINNFMRFSLFSDWNYSDQLKVANLITTNFCPQNFNVAATMQGDTRFYDLRYLLDLKNCQPLSVESYPQSQTIFLVAPNSHTPESETVWEISSFKPFKIVQNIPINRQLNFFQLEHTVK